MWNKVHFAIPIYQVTAIWSMWDLGYPRVGLAAE